MGRLGPMGRMRDSTPFVALALYVSLCDLLTVDCDHRDFDARPTTMTSSDFQPGSEAQSH